MRYAYFSLCNGEVCADYNLAVVVLYPLVWNGAGMYSRCTTLRYAGR